MAHGNAYLRRCALDIIESTLEAVNPYQATKNLIQLEGNLLRIGSRKYDLRQREKIYIIGAGKATFPIARALEEILGEMICGGLIVIKKGQAEKLSRIEVVEGAHPIPGEAGFQAAKEIMKIAEKAARKDIVIACITGGSSALLPYPVESVTLKEKKEINRLLLSSGASIFEINAVRKHLSRIKGGRLGMAVFPAELINLTVSDVIGDALDYITGPTVPDTSTFQDARRTLEKYSLWNEIAESARRHISEANPIYESPRSYGNNSYHNYILASADGLCLEAARAAEKLGFAHLILSTRFDGESRELGKFFAAIAEEIKSKGSPLKPPCVIIGGGETIVTLKSNFGLGGPNQEFVLSFLNNMEEDSNYVIAGIDTDGTDGPTDAAGALGDGSSIRLAKERNVDIHQTLNRHTSFESLKVIGDLVITGHTGTNVNDLKLLLFDRLLKLPDPGKREKSNKRRRKCPNIVSPM